MTIATVPLAKEHQFPATGRRPLAPGDTLSAKPLEEPAMWRRKKKRTYTNVNFIVPVVSAAVAGAGLAYVFDPERGRSRRARTRDRMAGALRHSGRRMGRGARLARAQAVGLSRRAWHAIRPHGVTTPDDITLVHRVESEVYRENHDAKGAINVSAFAGTVTLRGALKRPDDIRHLVAKVQKVPGVRQVDSLLHVEGTPAPNKAEAIEASHHVDGF